MIERIKEENVWDFLKKDGKPVMIYGMGNGAEKIISTLNTYQITVSEIFASDEFVRGHSFLGYKVLKYSEVCEKYDDFNVVLAFATHLENVIENIKKINSEHKVFAPDVPVAGGGLFTREYVKEHNDDFDFVYEHLADEKSKKDYGPGPVRPDNFAEGSQPEIWFFCKRDPEYYAAPLRKPQSTHISKNRFPIHWKRHCSYY
mgnify:CR=1 FL=1